jgi:Sir2 family
MHGELLKARCAACGATTSWYDDLMGNEGCPTCAIEGRLRPHVVWFGEMPLRLDAIYQVLVQCKVFVSIGASGSVEPAASFVEEARRAGAHTVELNLEPSQSAGLFAERIYGPASRIVPQLSSARMKARVEQGERAGRAPNRRSHGEGEAPAALFSPSRAHPPCVIAPPSWLISPRKPGKLVAIGAASSMLTACRLARPRTRNAIAMR